MRIAYADPPYPGQSAKHYGEWDSWRRQPSLLSAGAHTSDGQPQGRLSSEERDPDQ